MATSGFLHTNKTLDIFHFERTGDKEEYESTPSFTGVKAQIIPASADLLAVFPGIPSYQLHEIFVYEQGDIRNGDKLVDQDAVEYIVRGVPQKVNTGILNFQQIVGEKQI